MITQLLQMIYLCFISSLPSNLRLRLMLKKTRICNWKQNGRKREEGREKVVLRISLQWDQLGVYSVVISQEYVLTAKDSFHLCNGDSQLNTIHGLLQNMIQSLIYHLVLTNVSSFIHIPLNTLNYPPQDRNITFTPLSFSLLSGGAVIYLVLKHWNTLVIPFI